MKRSQQMDNAMRSCILLSKSTSEGLICRIVCVSTEEHVSTGFVQLGNWSSCNEQAGLDYAYEARIVSSTNLDKLSAEMSVTFGAYRLLQWTLNKCSAFSVRCSLGPIDVYAGRIDWVAPLQTHQFLISSENRTWREEEWNLPTTRQIHIDCTYAESIGHNQAMQRKKVLPKIKTDTFVSYHSKGKRIKSVQQKKTEIWTGSERLN